MRYNHLDMLPEEAFQKVGVGKSIKLYGKGGKSAPPAPTNQTVTQTNLPEYARPYFENLLNRTQAQSYQPYQTYGGARIAGFTPEQLTVQRDFANLETPDQFRQATQGFNLAGGLSSLGARAGLDQALSYDPTNYTEQRVNAPNLRDFGMSGAQSGYNPDLQYFQMGGPREVTSRNFGQGAANYYSNPYQQNVTNTALREALQKGAMDKNALMSGAIGRGTFGGARNALLQAEQNRGLNQQLSDIQYRGASDAYTNAQQQFQADQARNMQAQLANQQSGLTADQANLQAALQTQGLGANIGKDMALANLSNEQQARVQNLASQLQTQGLSAEQAMRAALANQQAGLTANSQNQQAQQYAAGLGQQLYNSGLSGIQASASGLGTLGSQEQGANLARLNAQQAAAAQEQALKQTQLDTAYQDFLRQRDYPQEQLGFYSNILRGLPVQLASTTQSYQAPASIGSQISGLGLGALGLSKALG